MVGPGRVQPSLSPVGGVGCACGQQAGCLAPQLTHPLPATSSGLAEKWQNQQSVHSHSAWAQAGILLFLWPSQGHVRALPSLYCLESPCCDLTLCGLLMYDLGQLGASNCLWSSPAFLVLVPREPTPGPPMAHKALWPFLTGYIHARCPQNFIPAPCTLHPSTPHFSLQGDNTGPDSHAGTLAGTAYTSKVLGH